MVQARIQEGPDSVDEDFGLVEGPLGHLTDNPLDETYFNAASWEAISWEDRTPNLNSGSAKEPTLQL